MLNTPFAKTFMLLAVAAVIIAAFIYRAAEPRFGVPSESLRVTHPAGFSVVQPRDWTRSQIQLFDGDLSKEYLLLFFENRAEGLPSEIGFTRLPGRPTDLPAELEPEPIAGHEAYRTIRNRRKFVDTTIWFEKAGVWYRVGITVPHGESAEDLFPYVATLRTEPPAVAPRTTAPTTTSTTTPSTNVAP